jgi:hypothetical protein
MPILVTASGDSSTLVSVVPAIRSTLTAGALE